MSDRAAGTSRIYLLRHARAGWTAPGERDFERPLDARGNAEAGRIAMTMTVNGFAPALVLASPARRSMETAEAIAQRCPAPPPIRYCMGLYTGSHDTYLELIARQSEAASVLVVGHAPMTEDTARALVCRRCGIFSGPLARGFPTGGLAVIDLPGPLTTAPAGMGHLVTFLSPRDG